MGTVFTITASKFVTGEENLCDILQALTSLELHFHSKFYVNHPYLKQKLLENIDENRNNTFLKILSNHAADIFIQIPRITTMQ